MIDIKAALDSLEKLPDPARKAVVIETLRNWFKGSLYITCKYLLGYDAMTKHTHGDMCEMLSSDAKKKLIAMPRGTFKSSIGVVGYSIWKFMQNPNLRIMIDSEKYENSKNFIREIKGKLEDPLFIQLFGEWRSESNWSEGSITLKHRTLIKKEASITASGVEAGKTGQHYDIIIHDDLNTHENSETIESRAKVLRHYQMNVSILDPGGEVLLIGTRYATQDVIGFVLQNEINV